MGLIVSVYRSGKYDCTNGGISATVDKVCVVNIDGPFEPRHDMPAAILTTNQMGNPVLKPARQDFGCPWVVQPGWFMMGGNYAASSYSRFGEALKAMGVDFYGAIPIHDRQE